MFDLSGTWRAAEADEELLTAFVERDFDDGAWEPLAVPSHWRTTPAFAASDGPLLLRRTFSTPDPVPPGPAGRDRDTTDPVLAAALADRADLRWWLVLDGAFYSTDVWLDGEYLGDTEGYFFPHTFEVTEPLAGASEHTLAVEVTCAPQTDRTAKRTITGVFQHWDCIDPDWNPGGLWRPVRLEASGPARIRHLRVLCREVDAAGATVFVRAVLDVAEAGPVELVTSVGGQEHAETRPLAAGENRVEWTVTVPEPDLWWPRALGAQPLHDVHVEVRTGGQVSDRRTRRLGFRTVRLRDWILEVNGERLFVKGSNLGPTRVALADATPEELRRDVDLAVDAGLDMLRIHAHVTRPELYDAADEAGLLLWQDFPLQWGYARTIRRQARRQAREMVDLLAHHPSVAVWCGHNEPLALDIDPDTMADPTRTRRVARRAAVAMALPTWNKTVLDHAVRRVLSRNDPSRPVVAHSGVLPHPPQLEGTDSHLYFGWYVGDERQFPDVLRWWPRLARFVSEFGAQAVPETADFCQPERWPDLDWDHLVHHHALQRSRFDQYVPPDEYPTFEAWRAATQAYQATVVRHHVETLRRLKYRPTGGFLQFSLTDAQPAVSWSVLDHERVPKQGYAALREACAPVLVVADRLPPHVHPGDDLVLDVHVVSDLRRDIPEAEVEAVVRWAGGEHRWRWAGRVPADECELVGTLEVRLPEDLGADPTAAPASHGGSAAGEVELELSLRGGGHEVVRHQRAPVARH